MACKRSLALLVCPYAPFLVPKGCHPLLRRLEREGALTTTPPSNSRDYATQTKSNPRSRESSTESAYLKRNKRQDARRPQYPRPDSHKAGLVDQYLKHIQEEHLEGVMHMYPRLASEGLLKAKDTASTVRLLHNHYRRTPNKKGDLPRLLEFADIIVRDLQTKLLRPHPAASMRLLSFYKEADQLDTGVRFWNWLIRQDDNHVSAQAYGAAIELLAKQGQKSLQDLEQLYQDAIKRFEKSNFMSYHLSHNAQLADRSKWNDLSGLATTLLQGIITARLYYGDWQQAYLGLDTCLRLYPTQVPSRIFELFIEERPIPEAFTVFMMACRGALVTKADVLTWLLHGMVKAQAQSPIGVQLDLIRSMANAIHSYVGVGGELHGPHLGVFIKALEVLLPDRYPGSPEVRNDANIQFVVNLAERVMATFYEAGIEPSMHMLATLMTIAGKTGHSEMLRALEDTAKSREYNLPAPVQRTAVMAAGQLGDRDILESLWKTLVHDAETEGRPLEFSDWLALADAGRRCQHVSFVEKQIQAMDHAITPEIAERTRDSLYRKINPVNNQLSGLETKILAENFQSVMNKFTYSIDMIRENRLEDFYRQPITMHLNEQETLGPEKSLRLVHDELCPDAPPVENPEAPATPPAISSTGFKLDELRYENWKTMSELLVKAEIYSKQKERVVDAALRSGTPYPRGRGEDLAPYFSSRARAAAVEQDLAALRSDVRRLRML